MRPLAAGFLRTASRPATCACTATPPSARRRFFEQVVMPLHQAAQPAGPHQAAATLVELTRLGAELREALLRQALRPYLEA